MIERKKHPLVMEHDKYSGFYGIVAGDRIIETSSGKCGFLDGATHDGDAFLSFDDGTFATVRWNNVEKEKR